MKTQEENQDTVQTSARNSFPEPRTLPTKWDMSEISSAPKTDADVDEDEPTDS